MADFSEYIAGLPDNHVEAIHQVCSDFFNMHALNNRENGTAWSGDNVHDYQMFFQLASKFVETFQLEFDVPKVAKGNKSVLEFFIDFDVAVSSWLAAKMFESKYAPNADGIMLSAESAASIQERTNELRELVVEAGYIEEKHRARLLNRLEKFQRELHKTISSFDVFLAGWSEVNDMVEDTGEKARPLVDRFREIVSAVKKGDQKRIGVEEKPKQITDQSESEPET